MGNGYKRAGGTDVWSQLGDQRKELLRQLEELQSASGTQLTDLVAQVKAKLAELDTTVNALVAAALGNYYTIAQTNSLVANPGDIAPNNVTAAAGVNAADLYTRNGPGVNITAARVAGWLQNSDGRVGTATSSRRFKTGEVLANVDPRAVLRVMMKHWHYIAEVRRRDDPKYEHYVGPEYHVATNLGPIAEDLHAEGLWQFVVYERDTVYESSVEVDDDGVEFEVQRAVGDKLRLNKDGEPIPFAVHDQLWGYAQHAVLQWHDKRLARIEETLGLKPLNPF